MKELDSKKVASLAKLWPKIERFSILHKYQKALLTIGASEFNGKQPPWRDAESLIELRDAIVHYKPEWNNELNIHKNIEIRLQGKFRECVFAHPSSLWFPDKCLGSGCAQWSVNTITKFVYEFCQRAQIPKRF